MQVNVTTPAIQVLIFDPFQASFPTANVDNQLLFTAGS